MFGFNLRKHINELRRYVRNYQYEVGEGGIYFPKAHASIAGMYTHDVNGMDERTDSNIITDEGLNHILNVVMLGNPVAVVDWFVMLHSGTGTPNAGTDADNYHAQLVEITSGSEGYSEAARVTWVPDAVDLVETEVTNDASPAVFTIVTATSLDVNGAGLTSISTKTSQAGTLMSAGKFSATRTLANTDSFNLKYKVDFDAI